MIKNIYDNSELYDRAFSYRNISQETDFLISLFLKYNGNMPTSFLELAAGPARHTIQMAKKGIRFSTAVDISTKMRKYGLANAKNEGVKIEYLVDDMCLFSLKKKYDIAVTLLDSSSHILSDSKFVSHLNSVQEHLTEFGIYIIEMAHIDGYDSSTTLDQWSIIGSSSTLDVKWGSSDDTRDLSTRISKKNVNLKLYHDEKLIKNITDTLKQRSYSKIQLDSLIKLCPKIKLIEQLGAWDTNISYSSAGTWRMISIFRNR